MRTPVVLLALLATAAAPLVPAHATHDDCGSGATVLGGGSVHVDAWAGRCVGVMAINNVMVCPDGGDGHLGPLHVAALGGDACLTGVLVQRDAAPAPVLP